MTGDRRGDGATYECIRAVKSEVGRELMLRHGAHAIGIARRVEGGADQDEPVLTFYVDPGAEPVIPVPPVIEHTLAGDTRPVRIPTQVLERSRARRG